MTVEVFCTAQSNCSTSHSCQFLWVPDGTLTLSCVVKGLFFKMKTIDGTQYKKWSLLLHLQGVGPPLLASRDPTSHRAMHLPNYLSQWVIAGMLTNSFTSRSHHSESPWWRSSLLPKLEKSRPALALLGPWQSEVSLELSFAEVFMFFKHIVRTSMI